MISRAAGFIGSRTQEILESGGYTPARSPHPARRMAAYRPWKARATKTRRVAQASTNLLALIGAPNTPQLGAQTELRHPGNHLSVLVANAAVGQNKVLKNGATTE